MAAVQRERLAAVLAPLDASDPEVARDVFGFKPLVVAELTRMRKASVDCWTSGVSSSAGATTRSAVVFDRSDVL